MPTPRILEEIWKKHLSVTGEEITLMDWFLRYYDESERIAGKMAKRIGVSRQTIYKFLWEHELIPKHSWDVFTVQGITGNVSELSRHFNKKSACVFNRLAKNYTLEEALTIPLFARRTGKLDQKIEYNGEVLTLTGHAKKYGLEPNLVWGRYKSGYPLDKCFAGSKNN